MNFKIALITLLCLLLIPTVNGQFGTFDLGSYKLPDVKTNILDLGFNLNQAASNNSSNSNGRLSSNHSSEAGGLLNINFFQYKYNRNYQGNQQVSARLEPDYSKSKSIFDTISSNNLLMSFIISSKNRFFSQSNYFIEINSMLGLGSTKNYTSNSDQTIDDKNKNHQVEASVAVGRGRIEPVEDARHAIYILDELMSNGRITQRPSDDLILDMAREISKIKRKRFFDSRIRKIEELQVVDSFLKVNNIISKNDIVYFTRLNDMWNFASGPARNNGFSLSLGFDNKNTIQKNSEEASYNGNAPYTSKVEFNRFRLGPYLEMMWYKPVNLYWQSDLTFRQSYYYEILKAPLEPDNKLFNREINNLSSRLSYNLQYIPNSRTSVKLNVSEELLYSFGEKQYYDTGDGIYVTGDFSQIDFNSNGNLAVQYYISPQLRLDLTWSINWHKYINNETFVPDDLEFDSDYKIFSNSILAKLTYSIF